MRILRASWTMLLPLAIYLAAVIVVGCGGSGGGGSSTGGVTGGNSGGGSTGGSTTGGSGGGSTTGGSTTGGSTTGGGTTGGTGGTGADAGIVYFLSDKDGPLSIYQINVDGTGVAPVSSQTFVGAPCVSWDGAAIAYEKWDLYGSVYKMDALGSNIEPVYEPEFDCLNPSLSPNGLYVIFAMNDGGVPQLFRTTTTGVGLVPLTNETEGVAWGRYSPDGTKIVYVTNSGLVDIKIMDADGGNVQTIASGPEIQDMPMFSPDGSTIVYMENFGSEFSPNFQIMAVPVTGGTPVRLTNDLQDDRSPCFSEDGNYIVFTREVGPAREIFFMPAAGGTATQASTFGFWTGWLSAKKR